MLAQKSKEARGTSLSRHWACETAPCHFRDSGSNCLLSTWTQVPGRGSLRTTGRMALRSTSSPEVSSLCPGPSFPPPSLKTTATWVVEGHQDVENRLHGAALSLLHDAASLDLGCVDFFPHTACGIQDEAQAGSWRDVQQPEVQVRDATKGLHLSPVPSSSVPQEH